MSRGSNPSGGKTFGVVKTGLRRSRQIPVSSRQVIVMADPCRAPGALASCFHSPHETVGAGGPRDGLEETFAVLLGNAVDHAPVDGDQFEELGGDAQAVAELELVRGRGWVEYAWSHHHQRSLPSRGASRDSIRIQKQRAGCCAGPRQFSDARRLIRRSRSSSRSSCTCSTSRCGSSANRTWCTAARPPGSGSPRIRRPSATGRPR